MEKKWLLIAFLVIALKTLSQVSLTTAPYSQDFGTTDVTSWTDNSTYPGWYATDIGGTLHQNITAALPTNTGAFYTYECDGDNDQKIGSRASGGTGTIQYGVLFRNQTGSTITSFRLTYKCYQLSLAQNGNNVNTIAVAYLNSAGVPTLASGGYVNVTALNFVQLQNSTVAGANQINSYVCTQSATVASCVNISIPNNNYLMIRWTDVDDGSNDHHMAIDDVYLEFDVTTTSCAIILPVELTNFLYDQTENKIIWETTDERDIYNFELERGKDGITFETIASFNPQGLEHNIYYYVDEFISGTSYYRLKINDVNGKVIYSSIIAGRFENINHYIKQDENYIEFVFPDYSEHNWVELNLIDFSGRLIRSIRKELTNKSVLIEKNNLPEGIYIYQLKLASMFTSNKLVIFR